MIFYECLNYFGYSVFEVGSEKKLETVLTYIC